MPVACAPSAALLGKVSAYYGFREETSTPMRRREGPGSDVVVLISFGEDWMIDGAQFTSFAAGLHSRQVATEHGGRSFGMQINLVPPAAWTLFEVPMHLLVHRVVPLEDVLQENSLDEQLHDAGDWSERFRMLDAMLAKRFAAAPAASPGVAWAWRRLLASGGRVPIRALAEELDWSRKRIVARFREEVGLGPKAAARLIRFERARAMAETAVAPDWTRIAIECGYYDQSHLIHDFRAVTGRTPETFFQEAVASGP